MGLKSRAIKAFGSVALGSTLVAGVASSALAETVPVSVNATAEANVCSVEITTDPSPVDLNLPWSQITGWPANTQLPFELNLALSATGGPGERDCDMTTSNSAFESEDEVVLLGAGAMRVDTFEISNPPYGPIVSPGAFDGYLNASVNVPVGGTTFTLEMNVDTSKGEFDPIGHPGVSINQDAPADAYKSTVTVTFIDAP